METMDLLDQSGPDDGTEEPLGADGHDGEEGIPQEQETEEQGRHQFRYDVKAVDRTRPVVLVIDDSAMIRYLVGEVVERMGAQVAEAGDGVVGMTLARHYRPDVILLDVHMEAKGGLETLREIRADPVIGSTPVIMLTVDAKRDVIRQALEWKADGYLVKPVTARKLKQTVARFLRRR